MSRRLGSINVKLNGTARRIRDVILDRLSFENGACVQTKASSGSARTYGLEVEARLRLHAAWTGAPDTDFRASLSRNWSRVDRVPGNLGVDWRFAGLPLTAGASLTYRGSMRATTSLTRTTASNALDTLDLYALWKLTSQSQLRLAVSNLLGPHDVSTDTYEDASGRFRQTTDATTTPTIRLGLELKL